MRAPFVMGEIHEREEPMRAIYNRQARRAALCNGACSGLRGGERATSPARLWLTAYGQDLAQLAERVELELPTELVELLSPICLKR
jgi:hypothetical protein